MMFTTLRGDNDVDQQSACMEGEVAVLSSVVTPQRAVHARVIQNSNQKNKFTRRNVYNGGLTECIYHREGPQTNGVPVGDISATTAVFER